MRQVLSQANWHLQPQGNQAMFAFILRRLFQAMIVMVTVAFIAFMLFQYVGDPVCSFAGAGRHA
jgi:hypothetical protein